MTVIMKELLLLFPPPVPGSHTLRGGSSSTWRLLFAGDSIAVSPSTWSPKSYPFHSKDKGGGTLHSDFTVAAGCASLSSGSPELEHQPGEGAELLRVRLSTRGPCLEACPRGVIFHCAEYSGWLKCSRGCPSQRLCVPS